MQELNTCFQKATDRSFNLVRVDSAVQEHLRDLLRELENSIKIRTLVMKYSAMLFLRSLWFMSTVFFCRPAAIPDRRSYSSDSQVEQLLKYINRNLTEDLSIDRLSEKFFQQISYDAKVQK